MAYGIFTLGKPITAAGLLVSLTVAGCSGPAFAEEAKSVSGFLFLGPAMAPEFEGSDDYEFVPGVVGYLEYDGRSALLTGTDLDVDLLRSKRFSFGPSFSYRFGREDVDNDQVARLDEVDAAAEIGVNAAINFQSLLTEGDGFSLGLRLTQDVSDGHEGWVGRLSANYSYPVSERLNVMTGFELTAVSDDYAEAYFGVSTAEAARSGLTAYDAEGGLKDAKLTVMVNYALDERWGVGGYASYGQLLGDFADSSIVEEAGSETQLFGMLGLQYRF